ncbi:MAG: glycosyltransferase [Sphingomicrobium sp.]
MFEERTAVFLVNLVQDVNILRPLIIMASRDFGFQVLILVSSKFAVRDMFGIWQDELEQLAAHAKAEVEVFESNWEAFRHLQVAGGGIIFAGSESSLPGHSATHEIFLYAPATFLKVTLQHGFECVGFRHSAAHDLAHGRSVSFGADLLCSWQPLELLTSMAPSQRSKVHLTGPTAALQPFTKHFEGADKLLGIVCENLHSVRLNTTGDLKNEFVSAFGEFCRLVARDRGEVVLRPHPGGQYVLKNKLAVPPNAKIDNAPMYRLDLRRFAYGISAPSSVLIDMLLADIPTAVWRDQFGGIDTNSYAGLTSVSSPQEWFEFAREAANRPQPFVELQRRFLEKQAMPIEPSDVFARFASLFQAATRLSVSKGAASVERNRFLFIANAHLPTLQVCLEQPLAPLVRAGELSTELLTETRLDQQRAVDGSDEKVELWIERNLDRFDPDALVFSRYSGPYWQPMLAWAQRNRVPVIYQIDDDLLAVPRSLGERKFAYHNAPRRLAAMHGLLKGSDIVYASTERLRQRLLGYYPETVIETGPINVSGRVIRGPRTGSAKVVGYMASSDHLPNLQMVLPAIVRLLDAYPQLSFELFGSIPIPEELARFGRRVQKVPPISDYDRFLHRLSNRGWNIGICPLTPTEFNLTKSNNKWIEYTSVGIAAVASADMIYDECCADGCGILASGEEEWFSALERLTTDDNERLAMVARAQHKLETVYSIARHREQVLHVIQIGQQRVAERGAEKVVVKEDQ